MARIRTIKPEFWTHEDLSTVSETAALLAIALLNYADDYGYFRANPALIKAACFPLRETSVPIPVALQELSKVGWIVGGRNADGKPTGLVVNFERHQRVNKPTKSLLSPGFEPDPAFFQEPSVTPTGMVQESSVTPTGGKGKERKGNGKETLRGEAGAPPLNGPIVAAPGEDDPPPEPAGPAPPTPFEEVSAVLRGVAARLDGSAEPTDTEVRRYLGKSSPVRNMAAKYGVPRTIDIAVYAMTHSPGCGWHRIWESNASFARQSQAGVESGYRGTAKTFQESADENLRLMQGGAH